MSDVPPSGLVVVSGCNAEYYRCEYQLLRSLLRHSGAIARVIVYDLGLTTKQAQRLEQAARGILQIEVRRFAFESYPPFVSRLHNYAWKAPIISSVLEEARAPVLWLDSATIVLRDLSPLAAYVESHGTYTPFGGTGDVREFGHPAALAALRVTEQELKWRLRGSGVVAFNGRSLQMLALAAQWARLSLQEQCIAPPGASLADHRYEQLLLTLLLERARAATGLSLTHDELDISSTHPTNFLTTRNKTRNGVPEWADPALWRFFALRRLTNAVSNRLEHWAAKLGSRGGVSRP